MYIQSFRKNRHWAALLKVTSWVLMKMCIPWNPKVMLQFVQYSDGECELRDGIIGNFYSYTSMVLYWGVWLCMELENLLGDQNHWWQLIMWCIVRVSSCQADARWMRTVQSTHQYGWWQMWAISLTTDTAISNTWEKHWTPQKHTKHIRWAENQVLYTCVRMFKIKLK
jgi:hypothetical protein